MTRVTTSAAPPNSLLLVLDPRTGELPDSLDGEAIVATSSAIAIGTLMEYDGDTEVVLTDQAGDSQDELTMRWSGVLKTSGRLGVLTIYQDELLGLDVQDAVYVRVWTNDPAEPDRVMVTVAPATMGGLPD